MQETFLAAYKALESFDRQKEQAWICRIAVNKCLDFLKSAGRRQIPAEEAVFETRVETEEVPEKIVLEKELSACTGEGLKTVQTHIYRAKERLKKKLERSQGYSDG